MAALSLDMVAPSVASSLLNLFLVPAEVRAAGANTAPRIVYLREEPTPAADPWITETLGFIERSTAYRDGWCGPNTLAPSSASLKTAENLTAFFAGWPAVRRPSLAIDMQGRPSFASKRADFYLHLTVDGPDRISWYAVAGANEFFEDDVSFDGTEMPSALARLES
jgi:hypothetical protein